jgi:hypothetical protein
MAETLKAKNEKRAKPKVSAGNWSLPEFDFEVFRS